VEGTASGNAVAVGFYMNASSDYLATLTLSVSFINLFTFYPFDTSSTAFIVSTTIS
jgi:hypothetical protein